MRNKKDIGSTEKKKKLDSGKMKAKGKKRESDIDFRNKERKKREKGE